MVWYSMHQIMDYETTRNIIIGAMFGLGLVTCCYCFCRSNRRDLNNNTRISPDETLQVNPLRIRHEKILRLI